MAGAEEMAIAARIPAVLADEEATDETPGVDPSRPATPVAAKPAAGGPSRPSGLKWAIWAAVVLIIGLVSRAALRSGGSGPSVR